MAKKKEIDKNKMDIIEILQCIPHRYPFLMIDRVLDFEPGQYLIGVKNITVNEPCFTGHFPNNPVFPGVLIVEALAQASGLLAIKTYKKIYPEDDYKKYTYFFAGIDKVKFKQIVKPGDQLKLAVKLLRYRRDFSTFETKAYIEDKMACTAELFMAKKEASFGL